MAICRAILYFVPIIVYKYGLQREVLWYGDPIVVKAYVPMRIRAWRVNWKSFIALPAWLLGALIIRSDHMSFFSILLAYQLFVGYRGRYSLSEFCVIHILSILYKKPIVV